MLEEVAAKAAAMAEAQTQPEDPPTVEDSMEAETARLAGHSVKKEWPWQPVKTEGRKVQRSLSMTSRTRLSRGLSEEPMGQTPRTEQHQNTDLLQQITILCQTVQNLGKQMQEGYAVERTRRQQDFDTQSQKRRDDYNKMEQTMTAKMEDGFRGDKVARRRAQDEIKQMVKKDLVAFKEEMKSLQR